MAPDRIIYGIIYSGKSQAGVIRAERPPTRVESSAGSECFVVSRRQYQGRDRDDGATPSRRAGENKDERAKQNGCDEGVHSREPTNGETGSTNPHRHQTN